jgi:undecaprenyl-diphosphatase
MESLQAADEGILFAFENHRWTAGDPLMKGITHLGDPVTVIAVILVAMLIFFWMGRRRSALILLLISLLGLGITEITSHVIHRERPDMAWRLIRRPHTSSFPSGHALNSMAVYGALALLAARPMRRRSEAVLIVAPGFLLALLIGFSRPYLGVHYPSDVLAGWTAGLACALLALWADQRWGERERFAPLVNAPSAPSTSLPSPTAGSEGIRRADEVSGIRS